MIGRRWRGVEIKTPEQIEAMRPAGLVVARTLKLLRGAAEPGMTTAALDALAETHIRDCGATPSFTGYGDPPFPGAVCVSVNDEVVHGVPGARVLDDGDVVSIDCGAVVDGWHGDAATTVALGEVSDEVARLLEVTESALWLGIAAARLGARVGAISAAVGAHVDAAGLGTAEGYTGHGIGSAMHQDPDVPNRGRRRRGPRIVPGLALAVEPMVTLGSGATTELDDGWTVATVDGSLAAHFEHTMTVTAEGTWVLTALDGGRTRLTALGVPYGGV